MDKKIQVKVTPNAKKNQIVGWSGDILKIKIQAPAQNGLANVQLIDFLAKEWKLPKRAFNLVKGETNRHKTLEIQGNIPIAKQSELPLDPL